MTVGFPEEVFTISFNFSSVQQAINHLHVDRSESFVFDPVEHKHIYRVFGPTDLLVE